MEIKGQIGDIIYCNEINSYTIGSFETEEEVITVVGYLPFVSSGDTLKLVGKFVNHQEYGRQFKIDTFEKLLPETLDALEKYLGSGNIKGIGPSTAKKIIKEFGEETVSVFKFEPKKLANVKGITVEKAIEMAEEFNEKWELWQIVQFLEQFGITAKSAKKVYDSLGKNAIEEIQLNPYVLTDLAYGADFRQIDQTARKIGIEPENEKRIESGIKYSLQIASNNGNTCVAKENLLLFVSELLQVSREAIEDSLINLNVRNEIEIEIREEVEWIYLYPFYRAEQNVAEKIVLLEKADNVKKIKGFEKKLKRQEKITGIELSEKQKEAIIEVNENNVCVITGGPGTGKTTIIKTIIDLYQAEGKKVVLCAPTGRAAKKMSEATGQEAKTIHRLLEIGKLEDQGLEKVDYEISPIDADVIVIDEVSMVDIFIMNYVMKGIFLGTKLVLVGDVNQLPSVGPGSVLKDIIASEIVTTICLNKIFRQAAKSSIVVNAHNVNNGESFLGKKQEEDRVEDFFYINETNQEKILNQVITLAKDRLKNYNQYDFYKNIQVLTPTKKGILGTKELNKKLQEVLNPETENKKQKTYGGQVFREGDRVMQIKNNYDIFWERAGNRTENGTGVFNGELGTIQKIDEVDKYIKVNFDDDKTAWYEFMDLEQLELAYAITIHKAQGSEFDVVILPIAPSSPMLLTRNLLYTALTRAKELLVLIGSGKIIDFMIQNADNKKRNTGLTYKLNAYNQ